MDYDNAQNTVFQNVYQQVFFHKLASFGIEPRNETQYAAMLEGAQRLRQFEEDQLVKQANDGSDPFVALNQQLAGLMGETATVKEAQEHEAIANLSDYFSQQPDIYNSVLTLKFAEAQEAAKAVNQ